MCGIALFPVSVKSAQVSFISRSGFYEMIDFNELLCGVTEDAKLVHRDHSGENTGHVYFGRDHLGRRSLVGRFADKFPESTGSTLHLDCLSSVVLSMLQSEVEDKKAVFGVKFQRLDCSLPILNKCQRNTVLGEMQLYPWASEHWLSWKQCPKFHLKQIIPVNESSFKSHHVLTPLNLVPSKLSRVSFHSLSQLSQYECCWLRPAVGIATEDGCKQLYPRSFWCPFLRRCRFHGAGIFVQSVCGIWLWFC
ncbi:hypothetical protein FGIG_00487 [Fasciola gigantica]|uniref:Asparagine synthetase domain-containing protein 1 n=1 Tax=Fasciola gigantica TaxID=46835 RepID=A0A504Z080_FASGI|nr:hypothetical protein FGIG_00487 [Fasciola gigantica]